MKRTRIDDNNALLEMLGVVAAAAGVVAVVTLWQPMRRRRNDQCCNVGNRWLPTGYNIPKAGFVDRRVTVILGSLSTSKSETVMFSRLLGPAWLRWA